LTTGSSTQAVALGRLFIVLRPEGISSSVIDLHFVNFGGRTMSEALATYLNDHLGGAQIAVQLLESMRDQHDDQDFRQFASVLLPQIEADDLVLRRITEKVGSGPSVAKRAGGWILEKAARLKLGHTGSTDFELFESLELLALGIHGKLCLWKALLTASGADTRLREYDFEALIRRAEDQYGQVENRRLNLARVVFSPAQGG
jgi:hypothetical protein